MTIQWLFIAIKWDNQKPTYVIAYSINVFACKVIFSRHWKLEHSAIMSFLLQLPSTSTRRLVIIDHESCLCKILPQRCLFVSNSKRKLSISSQSFMPLAYPGWLLAINGAGCAFDSWNSLTYRKYTLVLRVLSNLLNWYESTSSILDMEPKAWKWRFRN